LIEIKDIMGWIARVLFMEPQKLRDPNYCLMKAKEYSTKAMAASDQRLKEGYEALAREYVLWASVIVKNEPLRKTI
jgi:hypothetical protein